MGSQAELLPLHRADGSASYACNGYSIVAAVNGPVEAQRRDELPEEATVDVVVRPATGVGGVRERHIENIIQRTLRHVILVAAHPRKLIQVTLQITGTPENDTALWRQSQACLNLPVIPSLLQASLLALLSTSIPLAMTMSSTLIAIDYHGHLLHRPTPKEIQTADSVHVLAFSSHGKILVAESEGLFDIDAWEAVVLRARLECFGTSRTAIDGEDTGMESGESVDIQSFVRGLVGRHVAAEQEWRTSMQ